MLLTSRQIKGIGRGHEIGFPTINLVVPDDLLLDEGIYAAWVVIEGTTYKGALHYGGIPTFHLKEKTMEVHLIDMTDNTVPETENKDIKIDIIERVREVRKFDNVSDLALQIADDIEKVKQILK